MHRTGRLFAMTILIGIVLTGFIPAQIGVIEVKPPETRDFQCQLYIGMDMVFTFSLDLDNQPVLNIINFTDSEVVLDAARITITLDDGRQIHPTVLKIFTGMQGDYMYRAYVTIHPRTSFFLELGGLEEHLKQIKNIEMRIGSSRYRMDPVRKEVYDVMLERLEKINLRTANLRHDLKELSIPFKGERERVTRF